MPRKKPSAAQETPTAIPPAENIPPTGSPAGGMPSERERIFQGLLDDALERPDLTPALDEVAQKLKCPLRAVREVWTHARRSGQWESVISAEREVRRTRIVAQLRKKYDALHDLTMELLSDREFLSGILSESAPDKVAEFLQCVRAAVNEYNDVRSPEEIAKRTPPPSIGVNIRVTDVEAKRKELDRPVVEIQAQPEHESAEKV